MGRQGHYVSSDSEGRGVGRFGLVTGVAPGVVTITASLTLADLTRHGLDDGVRGSANSHQCRSDDEAGQELVPVRRQPEGACDRNLGHSQRRGSWNDMAQRLERTPRRWSSSTACHAHVLDTRHLLLWYGWWAMWYEEGGVIKVY